jgi:hypothetical protein
MVYLTFTSLDDAQHLINEYHITNCVECTITWQMCKIFFRFRIAGLR